MEIDKMTITELKALAYDTLAKLQTEQRNLDTINTLIQKKSKEEESKST